MFFAGVQGCYACLTVALVQAFRFEDQLVAKCRGVGGFWGG